MKVRVVILGLLAVLATAAAEGVIKCNFASSVHEAEARSVGTMSGVLPAGCRENFAGWKAAEVKSKVVQEDGVRFVRFETKTDAGGQFAFLDLGFEFPGVYSVRVRSRQPTSPSLSFSIRADSPPYTTYWSGNVISPEWRDSEFVVKVDRNDGARKRGFYFYTTKGVTDIASVEIVRFDQEAYLRSIRRPPAGRVRLMRRHRFPLSLPAGWSLRCEKGMEALVSGVKASDGTDVLAVSEREFVLHSEPFQTNEPDSRHIASFDYRLECGSPARIAVLNDVGAVVAEKPLEPSAEWRRGSISFKTPPDALAFTLRFSGGGTFALDRIDVAAEEAPARPADEPSVTLAAEKGEIAALTRIQFSDEPAVLSAAVLDAGKGARLVVRVGDLYGRIRTLKPVALNGERLQKLELDYGVFDDLAAGQYRVQALVERNGKRVSPVEELVVTRVVRPPAYGKDAPLSPFGAHFEPRPEVLASMKAGGVNWMRLHDAGTEISGWWKIEERRGEWKWPDATVRRIRKAGVSVFAQLGTAPAWATHYGELGCERMGYFEKYLRPVDMAAWTNYVSKYVSRYKGEIGEYFIWNEPWGAWWSFAKDIKFYDSTRAAEDFGEFSKLTYAAVKRANPAALVSGYNTYASGDGAKWSGKVDSTGAYDACDIMDFHVYSPSPRLFPEECSLSAMAFGSVTASRPNGAKPIYMSEGQGASSGSGGGNLLRMSGLYSAAVPWKAASVDDCACFSDRTVRYVVSLLTERNLKRVFLYTTHGYRALGIKPSYQTLLQADGFAHPSLVAHSQMARFLEGRSFISRSRYGENGVRVVFSGGCTVYAGLSVKEASSIAARRKLVDLYGNAFNRERWFPGTVCYAVE